MKDSLVNMKFYDNLFSMEMWKNRERRVKLITDVPLKLGAQGTSNHIPFDGDLQLN